MISIVVPLEKINPARLNIIKGLVSKLQNQTNKNFEVIFVIEEEDTDNLELKLACGGIKHNFIASPDEANFQQKINIATTGAVASEYFAVLYYTSDVISTYIQELVNTITKYPDKAVCLPLVIDLVYKPETEESNSVIGISNTYFWHKHVGITQGDVELSLLLNPEAAMATTLNGALIKSEKYIKLGGLKPSMDMYYDLEFLLRCREFGEEVVVSPRIGLKNYHRHVESDFFDYSNISQEERGFWLKLAHMEYRYDYDRQKTYQTENQQK